MHKYALHNEPNHDTVYQYLFKSHLNKLNEQDFICAVTVVRLHFIHVGIGRRNDIHQIPINQTMGGKAYIVLVNDILAI